jgi:hypothetical protein
MTKDEYILWLKTRGKPGTWKIEDCRAADALVKQVAMDNFHSWVRINVQDVVVRKFLIDVVRAHFGSSGVDAMLVHLDMYPDWMG